MQRDNIPRRRQIIGGYIVFKGDRMCQITPYTLPCCKRTYVAIERLPSCPDTWPKSVCPPELCLQVGGDNPLEKEWGECWRCKAKRTGAVGIIRENMRPMADRASIAIGLEGGEHVDSRTRRRLGEEAGGEKGECWHCGRVKTTTSTAGEEGDDDDDDERKLSLRRVFFSQPSNNNAAPSTTAMITTADSSATPPQAEYPSSSGPVMNFDEFGDVDDTMLSYNLEMHTNDLFNYDDYNPSVHIGTTDHINPNHRKYHFTYNYNHCGRGQEQLRISMGQ